MRISIVLAVTINSSRLNSLSKHHESSQCRMHPFTAKQMTRSRRNDKTIWYLEVLRTRKWVSLQSHCDAASQRFVTLGAVLSNLGPFSMHLFVEAAIAACMRRIAQTNVWALLSLYNTQKVCYEWVRHTAYFLHSVICFIYANSKAYKGWNRLTCTIASLWLEVICSSFSLKSFNAA